MAYRLHPTGEYRIYSMLLIFKGATYAFIIFRSQTWRSAQKILIYAENHAEKSKKSHKILHCCPVNIIEVLGKSLILSTLS